MVYALVSAEGLISNIVTYDGVSTYVAPMGYSLVQVPDTAQIGGTFIEGVLINPTPITLTQNQLISLNVNAAQAALSRSDIVVLRCYENSVAVPQVWAAYRATLRATVKNANTTTLPTQPAYPAGT